MDDKLIRFISAPVNSINRRRRILCLLPLLLAAVTIGFFIQFSIYRKLNIEGIGQEGVGLQTSLDESETVNIGGSSDKQPENETVMNEEAEQTSTLIPIKRQLEMWEEPTLFNINFTWLFDNELICKLNASDPKHLRILPILVHTARSHFVERSAIRKSWGSVPIYRNWDIRFVFLLGEADRGIKPERNQDEFEKQEKRLKEEQDEFGDLVIGSFTDTYHNLIYKHLMGYKWILNFCQNATYVLKVDDDVFIDIFKWLDWLTADLQAVETGTIVPDIYCKLWPHSKPYRKKTDKMYMPYEEFPHPYYPPFCCGWAYSIRVDLIEKIYSVSNITKFYWIDDVFVTGQLLQFVKNNYRYPLKIEDLRRKITMNPKDYKATCRHDVKQDEEKRTFKVIAKVERGEFFERDMMCLWNKTVADKNKLGTRTVS